MDQTPGQESVPDDGLLDKSRVLDVKPLRSLVPVFPSSPNLTSFSPTHGAPPFVCVPPSGPFPPGTTPFYPFADGQSPQTPFTVRNPAVPFGHAAPISTAVPISSFRAPQAPNGVAHEDFSDVNGRGRKERAKTRSTKKTRGSQDIAVALPDINTDLIVDEILKSQNLVEFDAFRRADGDKEAVGHILLIFNLLRRKIQQIEDSKGITQGQTRRPDLRAGTVLMNKGIRTNSKKRVGSVPGVEVGDIFFFRMELCVIGLHAPCMAGIDYMGIRPSQMEEPLAVSIVSSGGYENNVDDEDVLIYSGQGGDETVDQKLERGNLALEKSLHRGNEVRVIRGLKDIANQTGKVYVYDGLYKVQESWTEKANSGCNVFKYKLVRLPGQREAFKIWKSIQQWRGGVTPRFGVILPDLTSGAETLPVPLVNEVDNEKGPAYFTYSPSIKYSKPVNSTEHFVGCACNAGCLPTSHNCPCIQKNGGYLPYTANGVLVNRKSIIYECGTSCHCPSNCHNRVSQGGLRVQLEVFKTKDKGWGVRSWDPIRAGAFICEYAGEVISDPEIRDLGGENENDHIFYGARTYQPVEVMPGDSGDGRNLPFPLIISAKNVGNVARFINHSCSPNVFWQPVLRANGKEFDLHIVFYAIRHIPPMTELTYDYGMVQPDKTNQERKKCLCRSIKCRGFY